MKADKMRFPAVFPPCSTGLSPLLVFGRCNGRWDNRGLERRMKILIVEDDEALRSLLVKELEEREYDTRQSFRGDEAFYIWQHEGPWKLVLSDYRFIPGTKIKDGVQLVTAIHEMNPSQKMAIMTAEPEEAREKLPNALWLLPVLRKPFKVDQLLRVLREPVLPL